MRPAREVTDVIKRNLAADQGVRVADYELDHKVPLDLGGAPLDLRNLQLQPWSGPCNAHMKDNLERQLSIMVCVGDLTLNGHGMRSRPTGALRTRSGSTARGVENDRQVGIRNASTCRGVDFYGPNRGNPNARGYFPTRQAVPELLL